MEAQPGHGCPLAGTMLKGPVAESSAPLRMFLGARDQRQCCLENGVLNQLWDVMLILFHWGSSGKSDPPSLPQFPHLLNLCRPLFL